MFDFDSIITLAKAGFSAEQITKIYQATQPEKQPEPKPEPQPEKQPEPQPENDTQSMLREMLGLMRAGNVNSMSFNEKPAPDSAAILASILAPERKKE